MNIKAAFSILMLMMSLLLTGCGPKAPPVNQPTNGIRLEAIKETALSQGAQAALAWRSNQLNHTLTADQPQLDKIFNFNMIMLKNDVLPPVLAEGDTSLNMGSPYALRLADKVYQIVQPPRFVTVPPTWRDYLWLDYMPPDPPDPSLQPKTPQEQELWDRYMKIGWDEGVDQANQIFSANLGRLKRDFAGMVLYRKLLNENMVTQPYVAKADLGVTGNKNLMRINDQVLRITSTSELNLNAKTWRPAITPGYAGGDNVDEDEVNPPPP